MELTPCKLPSLTDTIEVTSWTLYHGSYILERTLWKLPHGTYIIEVTSWNLKHGR